MTPPLTTAPPLCPHFGTCGGCQYQNLAYPEQLTLKRSRLADLLHQAGVEIPEITVHAAEPYHYRNRIRLRLERIRTSDGTTGSFRLGYNMRTTTDFLPITTCPIAAPVLWSTAESLLATASENRDAAYWLNATSEIELFANHDLTRIQLTFFCAPRTKTPPASQPGHFANALAAFQSRAPQIAGAAAAAFDPRTGPTGRTLATAGSPGLSYTVAEETYWITRGGFFQINRFLLPTLVHLVCNVGSNEPRIGVLAWDLYAGVGLFSRVLARTFGRITAVEANPTAAADLRSALSKVSPTSTTIESTTLEFLDRALTDRDRPDLIVLDPPRAGAGLEVCDRLNRIASPSVVYISCDPATLTRDLAALQPAYRITTLHLLDLFPQTSHIETIAILQRHN